MKSVWDVENRFLRALLTLLLLVLTVPVAVVSAAWYGARHAWRDFMDWPWKAVWCAITMRDMP